MNPRACVLPAVFLSALVTSILNAAETSAARTRAFSALPDWTGLWETEAAARLLATGEFTPPPLWGSPPYNLEWARRAGEALAAAATPAVATDLPPTVKICEPSGFPMNMVHPVADMMFQMLVTPEQTLLVWTDGSIRHIHTDGRSHPDPQDLWPTPAGHSIGWWEGQTLVVETIARTEGPVGPMDGSAVLSEQARFTERLRLFDADTLQNDMTIQDPERLSRPWVLTIRYKRVKEVDRLIAVNCRENDRNPIIDGKIVIAP